MVHELIKDDVSAKFIVDPAFIEHNISQLPDVMKQYGKAIRDVAEIQAAQRLLAKVERQREDIMRNLKAGKHGQEIGKLVTDDPDKQMALTAGFAILQRFNCSICSGVRKLLI